MDSSRAIILEATRRNRPVAVELPALDEVWTTYDDRRGKFVEVLEAVGGQVIAGRSTGELNEQLLRLPQYESARKIVSLVPGVGTANVDLAAIDSPHALADVDVAILPGQFGVAENAAVWVDDRELPLRVIYFLCQHLVLVVPASEIVDHMHAAYERLAVGPASRAGQVVAAATSRHLLATPGFGTFISGPSKTADIEQSLVTGAHGSRSLTVCLIES